jgi:SAM-dependent methyltransferase
MGAGRVTEPTLPALIAAANAYEELHVPALFGQWASEVADAAQVRPGQRVLDVACGTGILARAVAARAGPGGHVAGLDPSPGMLAVAKQMAPDIEWRQGVAESLPFPDGSFGVVVSQFGLMFFEDRRRALGEMLRALAPEGRLVVAVWDSLDNIQPYASVVALLEETAGQKAADALRAPFVLGNPETLGTLFSEAGVDPSSTTISTHRGRAEFPSVRTMVEAELRGWLPVMGVHLGEDQVHRILEDSERVLKPYVRDDGKVSFQLSAHLVTVRKPAKD